MTELVAIYAAILSTVVFFWSVRNSKPQFRVDLAIGIDTIDGKVVSGLHISLKNPSPRVVHITCVSITYKWQHTTWRDVVWDAIKHKRIPRNVGWIYSALENYDIDDSCPLELEPGKSHEVLIPEKIVDQILADALDRKIKASAQDQLWRERHSKAMEFPTAKSRDERST